ncbi:MAG: NAD(P)H-dependent oxidoreductase subunit E, partial [Lacisediminimonas sp.]|nr:NAD(P)H-dependent oxidoreductase subunit E [Lacisediminimonas sp.]
MNPASTKSPVAAVTIATLDQLRDRIRRKSKLKGRQADDKSLEEVRALIGARPADGHRRDLLIEHLHQLNDAYRCLHARHLVALAREMNLPMAEVYEVATFYHHFEVVKGDANGDGQAPGLTVRVCDGFSCEMAGAQDLLAHLSALPALLGTQDVRVVAAPCLGRCEQAPVAVVHQTPVPFATPGSVIQALNRPQAEYPKRQDAINFEASDWAGKSIPALSGVTDYATYRAHGGYALAASLVNGEEDADRVLQAMEEAITRAAKARYGAENEIRAEIDPKSGEIRLNRLLLVSEKVENEATEISLVEANRRNPAATVGDFIAEPLPPIDFGRIAAQNAK